MTALSGRRHRLHPAAGLALVALAMEAGSLVLLVMNSAYAGPGELGFNGVGGIVLGATYPLIGWLLASRVKANAIGWIFLVIGVSQAGTALLGQYAFHGLVANPGALPLADLASWIGVWSWVPGFVLLFVMVLVFPDGRLPSPRWQPALWLATIAALLMAVPVAIVGWGLRGAALLTDIGIDEADPMVAAAMTISSIGNLLMLPVGLAAVVAIVVRFRRSERTERQQLKWFMAASIIEVGLLVVTGVGLVSLAYPFDILAALLVVPLVPVATAVAILRYRLYEIDRLISRTLSWALVSGLLVAAFAGLVVGLQAMLAPVTSESTLAVAASTLVVAGLFQPLRSRIQRAVDRRFNRSGVDASLAVLAFTTRARDSVDLGDLGSSVVRTTHAAVAPTTAAIWLRGGMR